MVDSLYRQEAVNHAGQRSFGGITIKQPLSLQGLTLLVLTITIIIILFLQAGEYARKVTVTGYVKPELGISHVYATNDGVVEQLLVEEGSLVEKNQVLLRIKSSHALVNGSESFNSILLELNGQKSKLLEAVEREKENFKLEKHWRNSQLKFLGEEQVQIDTVSALQLSRTNLAGKQLSAVRGLKADGYISDTNFLQQEAIFLTEQKELALINQQKTRITAESNTAMHHLRILPSAYQTRVEELNRRISDLNQKIVEVNGRSASLVTAPIAGRIAGILINPGDKIKGSLALMTIVPQGTELFAYLQIPSRAVGFTKQRQSVRLMFDSFPYQQFGTLAGTIVSISETAQHVKDVAGAPLNSEAVYIAKVALKKSSITAFGKEQNLQVGMLLTSDIILAKRSILDWMAEPLYTLRGRTQ
ncbi:MAG: membrane fusion protein [Flavobacterium sp.]|jgi:membrane fusion protein